MTFPMVCSPLEAKFVHKRLFLCSIRRRQKHEFVGSWRHGMSKGTIWTLTRSKRYKTVAQIPAWWLYNYSDSSREKRGSRHLGAALSFLECRLILSYRDLQRRLLMCGRTRQYRIISLREERCRKTRDRDARPLSSVVYPIRSLEPPSAWCNRSCLSEWCSIFARAGVPRGGSGYAPRKPDHR
jgi:hypothetical protein